MFKKILFSMKSFLQLTKKFYFFDILLVLSISIFIISMMLFFLFCAFIIINNCLSINKITGHEAQAIMSIPVIIFIIIAFAILKLAIILQIIVLIIQKFFKKFDIEKIFIFTHNALYIKIYQYCIPLLILFYLGVITLYLLE